MAESKSLKEAVNEIRDNTNKHFGTKLPGNENKEQEQTIQELSYSQMIMGSLASMVWGVQNIKDDVKVKTLLSRKDNIYDIVKSIKGAINNAVNNGVMTVNAKLTKETITTLKTNLSEPVISAIDNVSLRDTNTLINVLNEIDKSISNIPTIDLTDIKTSINEVNQSIGNIPVINLTSIRESIDEVKGEIIDIPESLRLIINDAIISALDLKDGFSLDDRLKVLNDLDNKFKSFNNGQDDIYKSLFVIGDELRSSILSIKPNDYDYTSYLKDIKDRFDILNNSITDLYSDLLIEITKETNKPVTSSSISEDSINRIIDVINTKENKLDLNLTANGNDVEKIKNLLEKLDEFDFNPKELKGLNGLYNLIEALSSKNLIKSEKDAEVNLNAIKGLSFLVSPLSKT